MRIRKATSSRWQSEEFCSCFLLRGYLFLPLRVGCVPVLEIVTLIWYDHF